MTLDPMEPLTPRFRRVELVAQTEPGEERDRKWAERAPLVTREIDASQRALAALLTVIRERVGRPIRVTSGLRPPINAGAGARSQHIAGQAADIQVDGMTPRELANLIRGINWSKHGDGSGPRQVIAETKAGEVDLKRAMGRGSGRWVHVAILGPGFGPTSSRWLETPDGKAYRPLGSA